jgi:3-isopropylmalate/(R)-2-methylmalate dehydratase large subunit
MTLSEKILAAHAGRPQIKAGELVFAKLDLVMGTDVTIPLSAEVFAQMEAKKVFDREKVALINDHFVPAKDIAAAGLSLAMKNFARQYDIKNYFEVGRSGICHTLVPDEGLVLPGDLVVGADSHTCTYGALGAFSTGVGSTDLAAAMALGETWFRVPESIKIIYRGKLGPWVGGKDIILYTIGRLGVEGAVYKALEFGGPVIDTLPMPDRFTICNMAIEAGAKAGLIAADDTTLAYVRPRAKREFVIHQPDKDAVYSQSITYDLSTLEPQIAEPYLPSNAKPVREVEPVPVDQVVIGSCTNGRIEDFRVAAKVLGKHSIHPEVRMIIIPATQDVYLKLINEGLAAQFVNAGAVISPPTCGPCIGGHMGILGENEVGVYTTNRNFYGRNGAKSSKVYLAGPAVAAASAVRGKITDPRSL